MGLVERKPGRVLICCGEARAWAPPSCVPLAPSPAQPLRLPQACPLLPTPHPEWPPETWYSSV